MIKFNKASITQLEEKYLLDALHGSVLSGDGKYTDLAYEELDKRFGFERMLLTTSGTASLEMASILSRIEPGDEVIVPSFTFSSTVNAFLLRGAHPVFCDIRPDTCNIDEMLIEELITPKTKAICAVDYAGVAAEMDTINRIAKEHGLMVIEDAAQGVNAWYKGKALGTIGDFGCYSFHETKNYTMGEGGALLFQDDDMVERAEILREKGTNRSKFFRGQIDKYTWVDYGSSYLPSDMNAAYLYAQLQERETINQKCVFHYIPLHTAPAGQKFGVFHGKDEYTTRESERLVRLPMFYNLDMEDVAYVTKCLLEFDYEAAQNA